MMSRSQRCLYLTLPTGGRFDRLVAASIAAWHKGIAMRPGFKSRTCRGPVRGRLLPAIAIVMGLSVVAGCSSSEPALTPTPPAAISPDPEVDRILSASCYSCHTVEGSEELVARLQPSRWFGHDAALEQLNFSQW